MRSLVFALWGIGAMASSGALAADEAQVIDYRRDVKPIFMEHCVSCHGGLKQSGGLRLDTAAAMFQGGDSGPAITPGDLGKSLVIEVLSGEAGFTMPPEGQGTPPTKDELALIRRWVLRGAKAPADEKPQADPLAYWSYQPLAKVEPPVVKNNAWTRNTIDAFIAAGHEKLGLAPQAPASPHVLLRRLYLDLIGYPPTRGELRRFIADPSDSAYEAVVDDLLGRPQYGERWGRHWMDVWRYSDWYGRRPNNEIRYGQRQIGRAHV